MPDTLSPITKAQDQIIETIELVQERVIDTNQKVAHALSERVPTRLSDRLNDLPRPELPRPVDAVDNYFGFVQRMTKANHKFATEIIKVWTPTPAATPEPDEAAKTAEPAEAAASKSTTKSPAKKAPARKRAVKTPAAKSAE